MYSAASGSGERVAACRKRGCQDSGVRDGVAGRSESRRAQAAPAPPQTGFRDGGFFIQSADGNNRLAFGMLIQVDGRFERRRPVPITNTFAMRKLRPNFTGRVGRYFDFKVMPDFGNGQTVLADAYLDIRFSRAFRVRTGKDKTPSVTSCCTATPSCCSPSVRSPRIWSRIATSDSRSRVTSGAAARRMARGSLQRDPRRHQQQRRHGCQQRQGSRRPRDGAAVPPARRRDRTIDRAWLSPRRVAREPGGDLADLQDLVQPGVLQLCRGRDWPTARGRA